MRLLFDIGGTKTRIALSKNDRSFDHVEVFQTPKKFSDALELFKHYIQNHSKVKILNAAGGIKGTLDEKKQRTYSYFLEDWRGKPLVPELRKILKVPVFLENDTALVGLGEAHFGSGIKKGIMAYVTVSTGVGGVRLVDGKIDRKTIGFEPGKQIINIDGKKNLWTLEQYISGHDVQKRYKKKPKALGKKFWDDAGKILAVGIHNTNTHWSPELFVIGGSIMNDIKIPTVLKELKKITPFTNVLYQTLPKIKKAKLGSLGGLYGALVLSKSR